jgi:hypothetical protein
MRLFTTEITEITETSGSVLVRRFLRAGGNCDCGDCCGYGLRRGALIRRQGMPVADRLVNGTDDAARQDLRIGWRRGVALQDGFEGADVSVDNGAPEKFEAFAGNTGVEENAGRRGILREEEQQAACDGTKLSLRIGGLGDCLCRRRQGGRSTPVRVREGANGSLKMLGDFVGRGGGRKCYWLADVDDDFA